MDAQVTLTLYLVLSPSDKIVVSHDLVYAANSPPGETVPILCQI